jgi:hypothetical protein
VADHSRPVLSSNVKRFSGFVTDNVAQRERLRLLHNYSWYIPLESCDASEWSDTNFNIHVESRAHPVEHVDEVDGVSLAAANSRLR